jgi:DNA-binding SARP family transcriptional activator
MLEFNILGDMEVLGGGRDLAPSAPRVKVVLALLALNANRVVSTDALSEELWDERPPRSAATTMQTYVYRIRQMLECAARDGEHGCDIVTRAPGYMMRVRGSQVDAAVFLGKVEEGRSLWKQDHADEAVLRLGQALELWRGPVLADVRIGPQLRIHAAHLSEVRLRALELRIQADARLGRHHELIPELRSLVAEHRLNEWLHAQLIDSLRSVGRRAEALQAYQDLRRVLKTELGLEPTPEVQRLQTEVLSGVRGPGKTGLLRVV